MLNPGESLKRGERAADVSASEPVSLFVLKSLLHPSVPVLTLIACLVLWGEVRYGPYFLVAVLAFVGAADLLDAVPIPPTRPGWLALSSLLDIVIRWVLLVAFIWALMDIAGLDREFDWRVLGSWAVLTPVAIWCGQLAAPRLFSRTRSARPRKAVIVGASEAGFRLAEQLEGAASPHIKLLGFFEDRGLARVPAPYANKILGKLRHVSEYVARNRVDLVYIALPMTRHPRVITLLNSLRDSTASIYFVPDLTVCELVQPRFDLVYGVPVVAVCESPFYGVRGIAKRLTDIAIASIAIAVLSPILLAVALGVRLSSPGPIIFRQRRYGLDGKEIIVYKFRSMRVTEDGDRTYTQVRRNDERVTPFGSFIRSTSLDELPQLFNVLEGSMSIVGPRPHAIAVNEQYRRLIPGYMIRHKVKPGITGWAQVNGFRGGDDIGSMRKRIAFDLEYLRHWSLSLDLLIMLRTALVVWNDRHAY
ncbi:MAG TPA: undecaprenyl-phosphate glucose phosphotransferase [Steroidobacter sp.]